MKLYYRPGSCAMAVHIVLETLGRDYEAVAVSDDLLLSDEYKAINPRNQVPSLITDDGLMTESVAIMTYLTNKFGGDLTPAKDSWDYGQMMMMLLFMASQETSGLRHPDAAVPLARRRGGSGRPEDPGPGSLGAMHDPHGRLGRRP